MVDKCYSRHDSDQTERVTVLGDEIPIHDMREDGDVCRIHYPDLNLAFLLQKGVLSGSHYGRYLHNNRGAQMSEGNIVVKMEHTACWTIGRSNFRCEDEKYEYA